MSEPSAPRRSQAAVLLTASGATFLAMLDSTVTNLVVPALRHDFPAETVTDLSWAITAYVVLFAALLAAAGRLADVVGRRRIFLGGVGLFTLASLACAVAPNLGALIVARAVQGAGAAAMIPAALAILLLDGPADQRPRAIALWSASSAVAAALGPAVGGVLVQWLSWRSVFYINVPLGLIMLVAAVRLVPRQSAVSGKALPDPLGTLLLAAGIGAVTLGVTEGETWGWLSIRTLLCLVGGVVAAGIAVWRSSRRKAPAVEIDLWRNPTFRTANLLSLLYGMAQYPWLLGTVLFVTDIWRYDELRAGLAMTPGALAASVAALAVGRLTGRIRGPRLSSLIGFAMFLVGGVWIVAALGEPKAYLTLILPISLLAGGGMGLIAYGTSVAAALSAPPIRFAGASGMNMMARQVGGALGVAGLAVILQANAGHGIRGYERVYLFCTVLVAIAIVVTWAMLRFTPPPTPATPPQPATSAAPGSPAGSDGTAASNGPAGGVRPASAEEASAAD